MFHVHSVIAVVGFLDSIVAAKQNAARFGYSISPNRELVALGAANLAGSFIPGTLPAYGSITRYNDKSYFMEIPSTDTTSATQVPN